MPLDPRKARTQSAQLDRDIARHVAQFEADLARVWVVLRQRVVQLTNQLLAEKGRITSTAVNLGVARAAARDLQAALEEAGYRDLIAGALETMGDLAKYQGLGQTTVARVERAAAWSAETLDAFHDIKLREMLEVGDAAIRRIEQTLLRGIVGAQDRAELLNEVVAELEISLPKARTIYDTSLSEFSRVAVTSTATGAADEAFLYSGPIDGLTRPFCLERVGRVFVRADIDEMDNGQLDNTLITGGGYNCRHTWLPVPEDTEFAALAGTGEFVDDAYAEDVTQAGAARERLKAAKRKAKGN
jgi:hypothetical protein